MVDIATAAAQALIEDFSPHEDIRARLRLALSEIPIGDEYRAMEDDDWRLFHQFETYAAERGIEIWESPPSRPLSAHEAIVRARCLTADWPMKELVLKQEGEGFTAEYILPDG